MPDRGIRKARVTSESLPDIDSNLQGYLVRYRIISQDRNRASHWSPIFLTKPEQTFLAGSISSNKFANIVTVAWDAVSINKELDGETLFIRKALEYDVWARFDREDGGDWEYLERVESTSLAINSRASYTKNGEVQPLAPNRISLEIYLRGNPVQRGDGEPFDPGTPFLKVYQLYNQTI